MTTKIGLTYVIAAMVLAGLTVSCGNKQCTRTQYPRDFPAELRQLLASTGLVNGAEIVMCTLGPYRVATVPVQEEQAILVFQDDTPLYFNSSKGSDMFAAGRSVATLLPPRETGGPRILSYQGYDPTSGARVLVFDRDLDGQPDLRASTYPDKRVETEVWYQDRWQTLVHRGNERGVMVNGDFIPVAGLPEIQHPGQAEKAQP
jgi:hypothetical protein